MDLRPILAANIRRLRGAKGLSQVRLAEKAGVDRVFISKIETGSTHAGLKIIGKLADALDANPTELFLPRSSPTARRLRR
jgi:transcriptional regulator with XRE-family HTH domain